MSSCKKGKKCVYSAKNMRGKMLMKKKGKLTDSGNTHKEARHFSFVDALFSNKKTPPSPNWPLLFQNFLKQKLGGEKYEWVISFVEGIEHFGESEQIKILAIIGSENKECLKFLHYLKSESGCSSSPVSQNSTRPSNYMRNMALNKNHFRAKSF